jgi:hypothetical protein
MSVEKMLPFIFQILMTVAGSYIALEHKFSALETRITVLEATLKAKNVISHSPLIQTLTPLECINE